MPVTFVSPEVVARILELRYKYGLGYRKIGNMVRESKDAVMRVCKHYEAGEILWDQKTGQVKFNEKPKGIIKIQQERSARKELLPPESQTSQPTTLSENRKEGPQTSNLEAFIIPALIGAATILPPILWAAINLQNQPKKENNPPVA